MDQLSAHLDRGWDLAQRGDAAGAEACARRALELDPDAPEVHNLLGYSAALAGEADEALEHYRQAIALDESYFEAMLNAVEVLLSMQSWSEAIDLCDDAMELAESDEESLDCSMLKLDALLGTGNEAAALRLLEGLPEGPYANAMHSFLVGRAFFELGNAERSRALFLDAIKGEADHPDANYYLGLLAEEDGDLRRASLHFLKTRAVDAVTAPAPWAESPELFLAMVERVISTLDPALRVHLDDVELYVVDLPGPEVVVDGIEPRAPAFLDAPFDGRSGRLFLYQRNIERAAPTPDDIEGEVARAIEREITAVFLEPSPSPMLPRSTKKNKHSIN